jgi:hypothetical protein
MAANVAFATVRFVAVAYTTGGHRNRPETGAVAVAAFAANDTHDPGVPAVAHTHQFPV